MDDNNYKDINLNIFNNSRDKSMDNKYYNEKNFIKNSLYLYHNNCYLTCPKGTYSYSKNTTCLKCPTGTTSVYGSMVCNITST